MNKFKESLMKTTTKNIDENILSHIILKLDALGSIAELQEYKIQIYKRKRELMNIFVDFDSNMDIMETRKRYSKTTPLCYYKNENLYYLDKIIQRTIFDELENFYIKTSNSFICNKDHILSQILDRQLSLNQLFDNYEENIKILEIYNKNLKLPKEQEMSL
jgi:hypothetical protein